MKGSKNICTDKTCRNYQRYCRSHINFSIPEKKEIEKVSEKRKELDKQYKKVRKQYLTAHPFCEAKIEGVCTKVSTDIHHMKGKATEQEYLDSNLFLAVCRQCHDVITKNSRWAIDNGLSVSRHKKTA